MLENERAREKQKKKSDNRNSKREREKDKKKGLAGRCAPACIYMFLAMCLLLLPFVRIPPVRPQRERVVLI